MEKLIASPTENCRQKCIRLLDDLSFKEFTSFKDRANRLSNEAFCAIASADSIGQSVNSAKASIEAELSELSSKLECLTALEHRLKELAQHENFKKQIEVIKSLYERTGRIARLKLLQEIVKSYIKIMNLFQKIRTELIDNPGSALTSYLELRRLNLDKLKHRFGGSFPSFNLLLTYLERCKTASDDFMCIEASNELYKALNEKGWPRSTYEKGFISEFKGSKVELWMSVLLRVGDTEDRENTSVIYKVLLRDTINEFMYHFCSSRETNTLDKPEWAFGWILRFIQTQQPFFHSFVQTVQDKYCNANVNAVNKMVLVLLGVLKEKIVIDRNELLKSPEFLVKYVKETINFENSLMRYDIISAEDDALRGYRLVNIFLDDSPTFSALLNYMKSTSLNIIKDMFASSTALDLVYESVREVDTTKITQSADMLLSVLEYVKSFRSYLFNVFHKLSFLENVELALLKEYIHDIVNTFRVYSNPQNLVLSNLCRCASSIYVVGLEIKNADSKEDMLNIPNEVYHSSKDDLDLGLKPSKIVKIIENIELEYTETLELFITLISKCIAQCFVAKCDSYIKTCWTTHRNITCMVNLDGVSEHLVEALYILKSAIITCRHNISDSLYRKLVSYVFKEVDTRLLYELCNRRGVELNSAGAAQIKLDMEKGLESLRYLSKGYANKQIKVARKLYEACVLLNLRNTLNSKDSEHLGDNLREALSLTLDRKEIAENVHKTLRSYIEDRPDCCPKIFEALDIYVLSRTEILKIFDIIKA